MGLDASVSCACFRDGLTAPPPVRRELIVTDEDGWFQLDLPYDGNEERFAQFRSWTRNACQHEEMEAAWVWIATWSGYRAFQQALEQAGWARFPTLQRELPEANGGSTSAAAAAQALEELAAFRGIADLGCNWFLVDDDTDQALYEHIAGYDGTIIWDGRSGVNIGFDAHGLFVVSRAQPPRELFRAMRIEQSLLDPAREAARGDHGPVELIDLDSGRRLECGAAVAGEQIAWPDGRMLNDDGKVRHRYPRRLRVEARAITPARYDSILRALEEVFRAAVATGNPVRWT